ncbi:MAG TPA: HAD-IIA family hydrolase [Acidimicrobiia bacterium]
MTVLCDLDGVIYRGQQPLPGVPEALRRLQDAAVEIFFITNNSTRSPEDGAGKISRVTGVEVDPGQVLTSSLSAAAMLRPADSPVLVVGEDGVFDAVARAGLETTADPGAARSVLVGLARDFTYDQLADASAAIRGGARFIATNTDSTFPTEDGVVPGAGAMVAAIAAAAQTDPVVAGKPHPPMRELIRSRGVGAAWIVGDRADTDVALAIDEPDWRSILVLTGITDAKDSAEIGADHVVADFPAAVDLVLSAPQSS